MILYKQTGQSLEYVGGSRRGIVLRYEPTWLGRLLGLSPYERKYAGSGTVWRRLPGFRRCGTPTEGWLSDLEQKLIYEKEQQSRSREPS